MATFGTIVKLLQHVPMIIGIVKQFRGGGEEPSQRVIEEVVNTRDELADFKKHASIRIDTLEQENIRLKTRIREVESAFTMLRVLLYPIGVFALIAFVLALLALLRHV